MEQAQEHVSIQMEKLADSFSGELESLRPLSGECSIYRVAETTRRLHPSDYTPKMISIGPFHHGKEQLKTMEEHKKRYLTYFLQLTKVRMASFFALIKEKEAKLRNSYAETIPLNSDELVKMVLVDAVLLIELFLRYFEPSLKTDDDRIFGKSNLYSEIRHDFLLLENQLPLFILNDLFNLAKTATSQNDLYQKIPFVAITCNWFRADILQFLPIQEDLLEIHFFREQHFVDLLELCPQPSQPRAIIELKDQNIPSAKELHQAGVKFQGGSSKNLLDIKFNQGTLEIPSLTVYYHDTQPFYRNLLAFERMHGYPLYFNDYIIMMCYLISTPSDVELLIQNEIIGLGYSELLPTFFSSLCKDCSGSCLYYSGFIADLQAHCKLPQHKWQAILKQNYFNTPWVSISVIAVIILLLLTVTQTICSLIAL